MANCTNCGAEMAPGKKFCTNCGTPVSAAVETSPAQGSTAVETYPAQGSAVAASPAQVVRQVQENPEIISTGAYVGQALLPLIPVVGLVVYIVWACGVCKSVSRRNYARAALILWAIGLVFGIVFAIVFSAAFSTLLNF